MKDWQKMKMSRGLGITLIMLVVVGITMFALGAIMSESRHKKCSATEKSAKPQLTAPTPPTTAPVKPPTADDPEKDEEPNPEIKKKVAANPPRNILGDIAEELRENMTAAELDAIIAKHTLGDDSLKFYTKKEHRPAEEGLPNGVDVEDRVWQWRQDKGYFWRVDRTDIEWVTNLNVTLYNNIVVRFTYSWHREVDRGLMVK